MSILASRFIFATFLFAVHISLAADVKLMPLSEDKKFTSKDVPKLWGAASNGIRCAIRVPPKTEKAESGIPLELYFENVGAKPLLLTQPYDLRGDTWLWTLRLVGPRGPVAYSGDSVLYSLQLRELKPGETVKYTGTVRAPVWDISTKGRYTLIVNYEASPPDPEDTRPIWGGTIHSNEAKAFVK